MSSIIYTIIMAVLWAVNLFNDSGLGQIYQTTEKARSVIFVVFIIIKKKMVENIRHIIWLLT